MVASYSLNGDILTEYNSAKKTLETSVDVVIGDEMPELGPTVLNQQTALITKYQDVGGGSHRHEVVPQPPVVYNFQNTSNVTLTFDFNKYDSDPIYIKNSLYQLHVGFIHRGPVTVVFSNAPSLELIKGKDFYFADTDIVGPLYQEFCFICPVNNSTTNKVFINHSVIDGVPPTF